MNRQRVLRERSVRQWDAVRRRLLQQDFYVPLNVDVVSLFEAFWVVKLIATWRYEPCMFLNWDPFRVLDSQGHQPKQ